MINLQDQIANSAFVFRGYNVTNLGRSTELLAHPAYGPVVEHYLEEASKVCCDLLGRKIDLVARVERHEEVGLEAYAEAVALILAMEMAHLKLLAEFFGIEYAKVRIAYGYSLGEIGALVAGGVMDMAAALHIPLTMAEDCVDLAHDVTLGVLFSRGPALDADAVQRLCLRINLAGQGTVGISSYLSPNSILLMGQGNTIDRFTDLMREWIPQKLYLRKNDSKWPPLHTPIVRQRNIPDRVGGDDANASRRLHSARAAGAVDGDRQTELQRFQCPRFIGPMGRPSAADVGCGYRNTGDGHRNDRAHRAGTESCAGHFQTPGRQRGHANVVPLVGRHGTAGGGSSGAAAMAGQDFACAQCAVASAIRAAGERGRLAVGAGSNCNGNADCRNAECISYCRFCIPFAFCIRHQRQL